MIKFPAKLNVLLSGLIACMLSCESQTAINKIEDKTGNVIQQEVVVKTKTDTEIVNQSISYTQENIDLQAKEFINNLKNGKNLSSFFDEKWMLIYHEDNRCTGSTDGQMNNLNRSQIDSVISLKVKNDGDGWACEKQKPRSYNFDFDLKKQIAKWDRFEIPNYEKKEKNVVYVIGAGESDLLKLYFDENNLILKMEYRSEDPG